MDANLVNNMVLGFSRVGVCVVFDALSRATHRAFY